MRKGSSQGWLIDASIYVFRAWFQQGEDYVDSAGEAVGAVLGFIDFIEGLLANEKPAWIGVAFDESLGKSTRQTIYPAYKANRASAPENLRYQFRRCREYLDCRGICHAASQDWEADDILASWARMSREQGYLLNIVSADKDLMQLVADGDRLLDYGRAEALDYALIVRKTGIRPDQIADMLAIAGDKVDNIPGVPGVGTATAARLLRKFETIPRLLASTDQIGSMKFRGAVRVGQLIEEYREQILMYRQLTGLEAWVPDVPVDLAPKRKQADRLLSLFADVGYPVDQSLNHSP